MKLNKITVEPAMFLQQAGDTLSYVIFQNLFIDKICRIQLNYDQAVCQLYETVNGNLTPSEQFLIPIMNQIQESASSFVLYNSLVENCLPVFLVLFLGVWSDSTRRRKPCMLLSLLGKLCRSVGLWVNAYFLDWHPFVMLFTVALPHSLGGTNSVFHMAAFSYIADTSVPRSRTWRLGIAEACWQLGSPIGLLLGAYFFDKGGYLLVFSAAILFHLVAVLYTAFLLPEVPQPRISHYSIGKHGSYGTVSEYLPPRVRCFSENAKAEGDAEASEAAESLINPSYYASRTVSATQVAVPSQGVFHFLVGSLKAITKERPLRPVLLSLGLIMLLYGITIHGEVNMRYLFMRNKFQWREQQFSLWSMFDSSMFVLGLTVVLPIFSKILRLSDPLAGAIAALGRCISRLCIALAKSAEYLYIGSALDIMGIIGPLSARSLASKCVLRDERGKVFAFLGCIEAIVPLLAVPLYSTVYSRTLSYAPSGIYYMSSVMCLVIFSIFSVLFVSAKLKMIDVSGTDKSSLTTSTKQRPEGDTFYQTYRRFSLS